MRRLVLLIGLLSASLSLFAGNEKLQAALNQALIDNKVSAMQMTIIMPSKEHITLTAAQKEPVTQDTLFQIGSETKSFTAALLLKLESQGKLKLSDTVGKYFPQYKAWANIKLSQLLHNNSGIPSYTENKAFQKAIEENPKSHWTPEKLVAIATKMKMTFKPGKGWHYSNTNFILAGMIAEKVTQQSLDQLYQSYFLSPAQLNLSNTYYLPTTYSEDFMKRMAHGYDDDNRDVTYDNMSWAGAAGAMVSTSTDLADWAYALFHNEALAEPEMKKMMTLVSTKTGGAAQPKQDGYGLGIGMRYTKDFGRWYGHEGETLGYHAIFLWYPKLDLTIAVLTNGEAKKLRDFATSLPALIAEPVKS